MWFSFLACSGRAPPVPVMVPTDRKVPSAVPLERSALVAALGEEVVAACPPGVGCAAGPSDGVTFLVEPTGSAFVVLDRERLWFPAGRAHWLLQDGTGGRSAFPSAGRVPPPRDADWEDVPDPAGAEVPGLVVQLDLTPRFPVVLRDIEGAVKVEDSIGWPPLVRSGLEPGDVVTAVGSTPVGSAADARAAMEAAGVRATLVVDRGGRTLTVPVAPQPTRLRCWKVWTLDGGDSVLPSGAAPPTDGVHVRCPPAAVSLVLPALEPR